MGKKKEEYPVEEVKKEEPKKVDINAFINRKLKDINELGKPAKAQVLARRVIRNRKEN